MPSTWHKAELSSKSLSITTRYFSCLQTQPFDLRSEQQCMASSAMADCDKQMQQHKAGQDRHVMGYPVIAVCDSANWSNASLINHPAESTFNMTTMKRLYGAAATAGGVKQLPPWHDFEASNTLSSRMT
jgi:hypothetical protein